MQFLFYIINGITQLNAIDPCVLHVESCWVVLYSLCPDVDSMLSRWSSWSPGGLLLDSRWILDKKLAGLPPKKKCLNSTWTPGVDLESTWNMWGSVKSSAVPKICQGETSSRKLGIIYVDLMGPEAMKSASGNLYVMNIVDNHSSHPWTFCLKLTSDMLAVLQDWARRAEAESNERIGIICTDGGELDSDKMEAWCNANRYTLQTTAP